jgi:hypothetical protein
MIIGRGVVASIIKDKPGYIYFACGFSNREKLTEEIKNSEKDKVLNYENTDDMFVYFSGLNIYFAPETEYTKFKVEMENLIKNKFKNYCILRFGAVTWGDNPNTLVNFLKNKIINNEELVIQNVYRYINDKEDLSHWISMIPDSGKHEMNVTGRRVKVTDLVEEIKQGKI